jgi:uncharacterized protein YbjT (DUF2867 family)
LSPSTLAIAPASSRGSTVVVTGATGYIGGRLVPSLLAAGYRVRCLVRCPKKLADRPFASHPHVEIVACDLEDRARTAAAMRGCSTAFFLVHSMLAAGRAYADTGGRGGQRHVRPAR